MSNVIDFLERMGQDATLRYVDDSGLKSALTQMNVASDQQATILRRDQASLETLLGAQINICCAIEPFHEHDGTNEGTNSIAHTLHRVTV